MTDPVTEIMTYFSSTAFDTLPTGSVTLTFPRDRAIVAFVLNVLVCTVLASICGSLHWLLGIAALGVAYASIAHPGLHFIDTAERDMVFTFDVQTRLFRRGDQHFLRFDDIGFLRIDKTLTDRRSHYYSIYVVLKGDDKRVYLTDESYRETALDVATAIATVVGVQVQIDHD
jgi:hypothetical protein